MPTPTSNPNSADSVLPPPVKTKADFCLRYQRGEFGNHAPTWNTLEEFEKSGYTGLVHLRNRVAGDLTWYDIPATEVGKRARELATQGLVTFSNLYYSGMAPTVLTLIQGEIQQSTEGIYLYYSKVPKPMRESLREGGKHVSGVVAIATLRHYLDPSSYDWIRELLTLYPEHVIEFSTYSVDWGTIPGRNTVVWEVRLY